ncbi:hypothetical protein yaldo0001_25500 [Yersinia aldovae ATCC 35236]|nr:hypothetical protein yaldo0001_25500 [Yersinia aldovae ATCC 35236]
MQRYLGIHIGANLLFTDGGPSFLQQAAVQLFLWRFSATTGQRPKTGYSMKE